MRFFEFADLREGAIDVSVIVLKARESLEELFLKMFDEIARKELHLYQYLKKKNDPNYNFEIEKEDNPRHILDTILQKLNADINNSGAYACVYKATDLLTKILQDNLPKTENGFINIDGSDYPIKNIRVGVKLHNGSKEFPTAGGHMHRNANARIMQAYNHDDTKDFPYYAGISIYIQDKDSWKSNYDEGLATSIESLLNLIISDYEVEYYVDNMVNQIISIFSHELDHIFYYLNRDTKDHNEKTAFKSIDSKTNKKTRGYQTPTSFEDPEIYKKYLGSDIEIQAWASGAAFELMNNIIFIKRRAYSIFHVPNIDLKNKEIWNESIDSIINDIKMNDLRKISAPSFIAYYSEIRKKLQTELGSDKKTYEKVWRKFLTLLVTKLQKYKK